MKYLETFKDLFFQSSFRFTIKLRRKYREFLNMSCSPTCIASPITNIPQHSGTFVIIDELTLLHLYHPKFIGYIMVHSWGFTFYGFGQMYGMYPLLQYRREQFHCSKNPLQPACVSHFSQLLATTDSFDCLYSFTFSRVLYSWNYTVCGLFRLVPFAQ